MLEIFTTSVNAWLKTQCNRVAYLFHCI